MPLEEAAGRSVEGREDRHGTSDDEAEEGGTFPAAYGGDGDVEVA